MEILSKLPFDLQEYILVKVMKRYKLRDGKYVKQIDKTKYKFLDYIMRPSVNKNSYNYHEDIYEDIINSNEDRQRFYYKFYIKNLHDIPIRKVSHVDDDMIDVRIEHQNNTYYYEVSIYRLKLKNDTNSTSNKILKDIYYKGSLADNYFWDFLEFSYTVK
jgi:hypothetical protein